MLRVGRFWKVVHCPGPSGGNDGLRTGIARDHYNLSFRTYLLDTLDDLQSVHPRHYEVSQYDIIAPLSGEPEGLGPAGRGLHFVIKALENHLEKMPNGRLIVHDEYPGPFSALSATSGCFVFVVHWFSQPVHCSFNPSSQATLQYIWRRCQRFRAKAPRTPLQL